MTGKIFLLPEEGVPVAERANNSSMRGNVPGAQHVARIIEV